MYQIGSSSFGITNCDTKDFYFFPPILKPICFLGFGFLGLLGWEIFKPRPKRKFRCWLCQSETEFSNVQIGRYNAQCSYCELPCALDVDRVSPVIQATMGEIKISHAFINSRLMDERIRHLN